MSFGEAPRHGPPETRSPESCRLPMARPTSVRRRYLPMVRRIALAISLASLIAARRREHGVCRRDHRKRDAHHCQRPLGLCLLGPGRSAVVHGRWGWHPQDRPHPRRSGSRPVVGPDSEGGEGLVPGLPAPRNRLQPTASSAGIGSALLGFDARLCRPTGGPSHPGRASEASLGSHRVIDV